MTAHECAELLSLTAVCEPEPDRTVCGGYAGDLLSWVMGNAKPDDAWITIMSNNNIVAVATLADSSAVILAEGVLPDAGVTELALQKGINLYSSPDSVFTLCAKLSQLL